MQERMDDVRAYRELMKGSWNGKPYLGFVYMAVGVGKKYFLNFKLTFYYKD